MNVKKWGANAHKVGEKSPDFESIQVNVGDLRLEIEASIDYADLKSRWESKSFYVKKADGNGHYWLYVGFMHSVKIHIRLDDVSYASYSRSG